MAPRYFSKIPQVAELDADSLQGDREIDEDSLYWDHSPGVDPREWMEWDDGEDSGFWWDCCHENDNGCKRTKHKSEFNVLVRPASNTARSTRQSEEGDEF